MVEPITDLWELSETERQLVENELNRTEKLLWLGKPNPRAFAWITLPAVLFAIPWTAFALFWICGAAGFKIPDFKNGFDFFPLFGVPFVLIGFGMLSSPLWAMRSARNTVYAITTERILIFAKLLRNLSIRSYKPDQLGTITRTQRPDGSGNLMFSNLESIIRGNIDAENQSMIKPTTGGFYAIPNVKQVEEIVQGLISLQESSFQSEDS